MPLNLVIKRLWKSLVLFNILINPAIAFDFSLFTDNDLFLLEEAIYKNTFKDNIVLRPVIKQEIIDNAYNDKLNIVDENFITPKYFNASTYFWFTIYSQYNSKQVLIHDKSHLDLVYDVLDFNHIHESELNFYTKSNLQTYFSNQQTKEIKSIIKNLLLYNCDTKTCLDIEKKIKAADINIPKDSKQKKELYRKLVSNIRTQTGQRDRIYNGLIRFLPFEDFFNQWLVSFKLPKELSAVPFLESSFNTIAHSKVGAKGIWQIMPFISRLIFPKAKYIDYRHNPYISTIGALHLLKQNKKILKRWDLAVTAYNSGTRHIIKASRKLKIDRKDLKLEYIFEKYKHPHLGFASKNFYSEFLALVKVMDYKNNLYPLESDQIKIKKENNKPLKFYLTKCNIRFRKWFKSKVDLDLNKQFLSKLKLVPKGSIIIARENPYKKYFLELSQKQVISSFPKKWNKFLRGHNCSTI